ncbi:TolC family protein [Marinibactrum halimedae]|uniref:Multidrug transporter n=1 Tax=Marinibactrum halimedae TaxID=1444977 RepID=A0AA37T634_9GAMM|nr:TolC family protein [Marinibactrum halimedae]MCD9460136.1 TolC family protein [Marinibactrum halimedae]GLS26394.1 multidrug transporter [Marinibactrum halimedae]
MPEWFQQVILPYKKTFFSLSSLSLSSMVFFLTSTVSLHSIEARAQQASSQYSSAVIEGAKNQQVTVEGLASHTISLTDVLRSSYTHHPKVLSALAEREQTEAAVTAAQGAFDWQYKQQYDSRLSGYYDGNYWENSLSKPLGDWNAKVTAKYRRSDGDFPVYEEINSTLNRGEASIGVSLSLLKDRAIDKKRLTLQNAEVGVLAAQQMQTLSINDVLNKAGQTYLKWYLANERLRLVQVLVGMAEQRQEAIKIRVKQGDAAEITLTEAQTSVLSRRAMLVEEEQSLARFAQELSLYWRDAAGNPVLPQHISFSGTLSRSSVEELNTLLELSRGRIRALTLNRPSSDAGFNDYWKMAVIERHPALAEVDAALIQVENQLRLAKNDHLPNLDLSLKVAEDFGGGPDNLDDTDTIVALNFSMPLERRYAKASLQKAKAKERELKAKRRMISDNLQAEVSAELMNFTMLKSYSEIKQQQAQLAIKLLSQEQVRFAEGDSDQFILNSRETSAANALLQSVKANVDYVAQKIHLLALGAELESVFIQ